MKGVQDELNVELGRVDLPNRWRALLVRAGFVSCAEVLLLAPFALAKRTGLSERDVFDLLHVVSEGALVACGSTASPVASASQNRLSTGDDGIDRLLGGGLHIGSLTELAGQPASGKSHFGLQCCLTAQLAATDSSAGGAIFLSSEGAVPTPRLLQMAEHLRSNDMTALDLMDNVHVIKAADPTTLQSLLNYAVPARIDQIAAHAAAGTPLPFDDEEVGTIEGHERKPPLPIKLVVFDSVGAPFRVSHDSNSKGFVSRARELGTIGDRLHQLARRYALAVLAINQVSDVFEHSFYPADGSTAITSTPPNVAHTNTNLPSELYNRFQSQFLTGQRESRGSAAALGMTWTNIVNTRLMAFRSGRRVASSSRRDTGDQDDDDVGKVLRTLAVVFSPTASRASIDFVIDAHGIRSLR